jgi:hypothetical protein
MVVHYVEVNEVGACRDDIAHFFAESGKIGGQYAWGDAVGCHGGAMFRKILYFTAGPQ